MNLTSLVSPDFSACDPISSPLGSSMFKPILLMVDPVGP